MLKTFKIRNYEMGLYFRDSEFKGPSSAGRHWFLDPLNKVKVEVVSQCVLWLAHEKLDLIVRQRVTALGLEVISVGIRDVILPGDMKDLMNKVTEAKKAAELT